ncbi:MAG: DUF3866 family protein [Bacillota bacterium]
MLSSSLGLVLNILDRRAGITEITVTVDDGIYKAINYDDLTGTVSPGDHVQLNTTAVRLGLGTGGYHFVMANTANTGLEDCRPGHVMKLRYTPMQIKVLAVEEEDSPHRRLLEDHSSLAGTPVVVGLLHSMLAPVAAGIRSCHPNARIVYVMTDGGALPLAFSRNVHYLREAGLLDGTVTVGHAFGGDLEAVNIYTGLLAARWVLKADVIIAAMGPGILGTGTAYGFTGVEQGEIANSVHILGGQAAIVPRISFADRRSRHYGLSHHTRTVLGKIALAPAVVPLPALPAERSRIIRDQIAEAGLEPKHRFVEEEGSPALDLLSSLGLTITTMGRSVDEDREFFLAGGAAGIWSARLLEVGSWKLEVRLKSTCIQN